MTTAADKSDTRWSDWHLRFIEEERYLEPASRRRLSATSGALIAVGLVVFLFLLHAVLTHSGVEQLDEPVEHWFNAQRSAASTGVMIALAIVFGPVALPIIVLVVLVVWVITARHLWRPLLLASGMLAGVVLALTIAPVVRHPRPPLGLMLLDPDHTYSFPSGHVLGTSDFFLILAFLLASRIQRTWFTVSAVTLAVVVVLAQVASRMYLGYHWLTDTAASIGLSMVVLGAVIAVDTRRTVLVAGEPIGDDSTMQTEGT
jgi:undecaprenyl-diphosphatase